MLLCPACGASEAADATMLADAPVIVCRDCGETWPVAGRQNRPMSMDLRGAVPGRDIEAARKPLVTYSGEVDKAWAAKVAGDILPGAPRRRSAVPRTAAALASALFIAAFFGGREVAVAALPDLAGLYGSLGLPVNLDQLEIRIVETQRHIDRDGGKVSVRGEIANLGSAERPIPPLQVSFFDSSMAPAGGQAFNPPEGALAGAEAAPFTLEMDGVPPDVSSVVLRFRRPGEPELRVAAAPGGAQ